MGVLEKQLALAIDRRLAVFQQQAESGALLKDEMSLRSAAFMISELVLPCCCMLCNKTKLEQLLAETRLCAKDQALRVKLAELVYDDLARCNGLG